MKCVVASMLALAAALSGVSAQGSIAFTLDQYSISANTADPGIVVHTSKLLGDDYAFELATIGASHTVDLFRIWTNETTVNRNEDTVPKSIDVDFNFSAPPPAFGGVVSGQTEGVRGLLLIFPYGAGKVTWGGPTLMNFGPSGDGILAVTLTNRIFNFNFGRFGGLTPGEEHGATVEATFRLVAAPTPLPPAAVLSAPEPAALLIWASLGLVGAVVAYRRSI